ncbi:MAG: hypothetical protein NWE90_02365 [Candidatus Bathyarchaeota archaeon]|nr:hypothetical protein [Candidatus Bathyarchaeota archaeon]
MKLYRFLALILIIVGGMSLIFGILSIYRTMNALIANMEIASSSELQSFFYVATPQAILWSIAFTTFFASGILLGRSGSSDLSELTYLSKTLKLDNGSKNEIETLTRGEKQRNLVDERLLQIKNEVLKAIERLERLEQQKKLKKNV